MASTRSPAPAAGSRFSLPLMPFTAMMYRFLPPVLSAQFMTAPTGRPREIRNLEPDAPFAPGKYTHHQWTHIAVGWAMDSTNSSLPRNWYNYKGSRWCKISIRLIHNTKSTAHKPSNYQLHGTQKQMHTDSQSTYHASTSWTRERNFGAHAQN